MTPHSYYDIAIEGQPKEQIYYSHGSFTDVKDSDYYAPYVEWAAKNKIVSGIGGGKFAPNSSCLLYTSRCV